MMRLRNKPYFYIENAFPGQLRREGTTEEFFMELKDVQDFLSTNKDSDDVKTFVAGLNPLSVDRVKDFVGKDKDAASWLDSEKDKHATKSLETWKQNNLQGLVDTEYKKQHPDADPKDTEIAKLKAEFEKMQADNARKDLTNKALKIAGEKKLPPDLVSFFIGKDEDETEKNLATLEKAFTDKVNAAAEERLKGGYKPPKSNQNPATETEQAKTQINSIFGLK